MEKSDQESEATKAAQPSVPRAVSSPAPKCDVPSEKENGLLVSPSSGVKNDESESTTVPSEVACECKCGCQQRLEKLENQMNDLKSWKVHRQNLDDIIANWKEEVENWMQSTFGFTISGALSTPTFNDDDKESKKQDSSENLPESESQTIEENEVDTNIVFDEEDAENVEITPELFGHFLLDNEYDHGESDDDDIQEIGSLDDEEDEESEVPNENLQKPTKRRRNDDSESECYTLSSSSSEDITSEDEYEPQRKKGRGRGRGRPPGPVLQNKQMGHTSNSHLNNSSGKNNTVVDLGNAESRAELLKHCRKRQGNIWECTVCGFMLTSFENMLLHIKYNHSSSTHTCPYCRIVVLCRSPQDAILHQSQCKMRPPLNSTTKSPDPKIIRPVPVQKQSASVTTINAKANPKDVHSEIDKFVDDILGFGTTATKVSKPVTSSKNNTKKTESTIGELLNSSMESPAVVTLSSDEDED